MSLVTYSDLQTAVGNWLARSDLTSYIPDFITIAENRIFRDLRIKCMESTLNVTTAGGTQTAALPADFLELKYAYVNANPSSILEKTTAEDIFIKYVLSQPPWQGRPIVIGRDGSNFIFGPTPDSAYTINGTYYAKPASLSTSNSSPVWVKSPELYLYGSLVAAAPFLAEDQRLALWENEYQKTFASVVDEDRRESLKGSTLRMHAR